MSTKFYAKLEHLVFFQLTRHPSLKKRWAKWISLSTGLYFLKTLQVFACLQCRRFPDLKKSILLTNTEDCLVASHCQLEFLMLGYCHFSILIVYLQYFTVKFVFEHSIEVINIHIVHDTFVES